MAAVAVAPLVGGTVVVGRLPATAGAPAAPRAAGGPLSSLDVAKRDSDEPYALIGQVRICGSPRGQPLGRPGGPALNAALRCPGLASAILDGDFPSSARPAPGADRCACRSVSRGRGITRRGNFHA